MPILLFLNLKGGVAKTTNAVAVAECLASLGKRTLVIDADHQCAASELLLGERRLLVAERRERTLHDLLKAMLDDEFDHQQVASFVVPGGSDIEAVRPKLDVLPCSVRIDDFQTNIAKGKRGFNTAEEFQRMWGKRRTQLGAWLKQHYDYTIVDCPPSIPVQVRFLLRIADAYITPSIPDRISMRGALCLQERLRKLRPVPPALGLLWTLYREQNARHRDLVALVRQRPRKLRSLPEAFETVVPNATDIVRALEGETTPASFSAKYTPRFARLYGELVQEIMLRTHKLERPS